MLAVFVLAVFVLAVFVLAVSSANGGAKAKILSIKKRKTAKVEASPNGGATGSECKSQVPYAFPFEAFAQGGGTQEGING